MLSPFGNIGESVHSHLRKTQKIFCAHAVAYKRSFFDFFLNSVPNDPFLLKDFIKKWQYFDAWLALEAQEKHIVLMDINCSVFQNRQTSDTR